MNVDPNPQLLPDAPIEVIESRVLFGSSESSTPAAMSAASATPIRRHGCASLRRLSTGRLLMAFMAGTGPEHRNDGAIMLTHSDDDGRTWDAPFPVYAVPGWDSLPLGGIAQIGDDLLQLIVGRVRFDASLGGDEPFAGWFMGSSESRDGGASWGEVTDDIRLWPEWTELYGTSNPHRLSDGRLAWAVMGTLGRDREWQAGVTFTGPDGASSADAFSPPVIIAADPTRNFADIDLIRVAPGEPRFVAVIREMAEKEAWIAFSSDEARTWHGLRKVGFRGANIKLFRLRDGSLLCTYRDEDPARHGVSVSHSRDDGETWRWIGQLYADPTARHQPGALGGYPDMVSLGDDRIAAVCHSYQQPDGAAHLLFYALRDRT
jgi:BNR repeat-like domain